MSSSDLNVNILLCLFCVYLTKFSTQGRLKNRFSDDPVIFYECRNGFLLKQYNIKIYFLEKNIHFLIFKKYYGFLCHK
jgi:L-aspartate oxidase